MSQQTRIPALDLGHQNDALRTDLSRAVETVLDSGQFVLGETVAAFEAEAADYCGVRHAIGVNSGTDALVLALRALDIGPGDEVITSPFTFFASAEAISLVGATPVFADIDPETFNMDPARVAECVGPATRALLPVHLYGRTADMHALRGLAEEHGLYIIEDACQAIGADHHGTRAGGLGDAAAFSFYPTKNLGACGDGGLIATNDDAVAERCRGLRNHAQVRRGHHTEIGYNSRLDGMQAAILRVRLPHLDGWNAERGRLAGEYGRRLADLDGVVAPAEPAHGRHVYHQYTVRLPGCRDTVQAALAEAGIGSVVYYPVALNRLPPYAGAPACPHAERAADEVLSLPLWPGMSDEQIGVVANVVAQALGR